MKRRENMDYEEYKQIRTNFNKMIKMYIKGTLVWSSKVLKWDGDKFVVDAELSRGTYVQSKHGELKRPGAAESHSEPEPEPVPII